MSRLDISISDFYEAFSDVPKPKAIRGCPCCIDEKDVDTLISKRLDELNSHDLSSYASSALLTVGEVPDYLYFLPRILELSIREEMSWPDPEITGRAIRDAEVHNWSDEKRLALKALLAAVVQEIIDTEDYLKLDEWICAIGRMELDVYPFLEIVESKEEAVLEFWRANADELERNTLGNAFWDPPNKEHDKIVHWFQSPKINLIYAKEYGYRMK